MEQAKNFVCHSCSTPVPLGHKFCGRCGAAVPAEIMNARTQFFGQLQEPGRAKLILIRGDGVEGLSYQLNADEHLVGPEGQVQLGADSYISPKHANFFYRGGALWVRDEGSINGVYVRVRGTVPVNPGDMVIVGEQILRIDGPSVVDEQPTADGTFYYVSPKRPNLFRVTQMLHGGSDGISICARTPTLQVGREGVDLNFPSDVFMSGAHCKIEQSGGTLALTDLGSLNGTFLRIRAERELSHGDYVFIGRKLLRVEVNAA